MQRSLSQERVFEALYTPDPPQRIELPYALRVALAIRALESGPTTKRNKKRTIGQIEQIVDSELELHKSTVGKQRCAEWGDACRDFLKQGTGCAPPPTANSTHKNSEWSHNSAIPPTNSNASDTEKSESDGIFAFVSAEPNLSELFNYELFDSEPNLSEKKSSDKESEIPDNPGELPDSSELKISPSDFSEFFHQLGAGTARDP